MLISRPRTPRDCFSSTLLRISVLGSWRVDTLSRRCSRWHRTLSSSKRRLVFVSSEMHFQSIPCRALTTTTKVVFSARFSKRRAKTTHHPLLPRRRGVLLGSHRRFSSSSSSSCASCGKKCDGIFASLLFIQNAKIYSRDKNNFLNSTRTTRLSKQLCVSPILPYDRGNGREAARVPGRRPLRVLVQNSLRETRL